MTALIILAALILGETQLVSNTARAVRASVARRKQRRLDARIYESQLPRQWLEYLAKPTVIRFGKWRPIDAECREVRRV